MEYIGLPTGQWIEEQHQNLIPKQRDLLRTMQPGWTIDVDQEKELQKKETEQTITEETTQQARKKVSEAVRKTICL